jgi:4'-phosphopantetheinyl transferase
MLCDLIDKAEESPVPVSAAGPAVVPSNKLELPANEVHVWLANLNDYAPQRLRGLLAEDEVRRADRFVFERHSNHFIVARGLLRQLLASYLHRKPAELIFDYEEKGKPLLGGAQAGWLKFNLAHSHELAVYAFSRERQLGVDLEFIRKDLADEEVAERFFSEREVAALRALPGQQKREGFFNCWTRKEAYIKARGEGLSMPLAEFAVSLAPGQEAALLCNEKEPGEISRWSMKAIDVPAGYVGALVVEGQHWWLKQFVLEKPGG